MVYNAANQSHVSAMEIESEASIFFQPSESGILSPFPTFEPSNLTAASSSSLPTDQPASPTVTLSASRLSKNLRLEHYLNKIMTSFDYSAKVNNCVIDYLKKKLKDNKKGAVKKEKQSCLCINCLNPLVILSSINKYRYSQKLPPHGSLTIYLNKLKSGMLIPEMEAQNTCKCYESKRVIESYVGKDGKVNEYTRTADVDHFEPVYLLFEKLKDLSDKYLLHRAYVGNCTSVSPILKEVYDGKYIELDFSQNLALRPKDEVQSAYFSGK